ncbi:hypothetical protein Plhal703r1_c35g0130001 [Plasmopara halstedii]
MIKVEKILFSGHDIGNFDSCPRYFSYYKPAKVCRDITLLAWRSRARIGI